jgi:hypothetical protein
MRPAGLAVTLHGRERGGRQPFPTELMIPRFLRKQDPS